MAVTGLEYVFDFDWMFHDFALLFRLKRADKFAHNVRSFGSVETPLA
jgi:hypothetical protein